MSNADNASLLAMHAARMSPASIALTMGWSVERVNRRLQALTTPAPDAPEPEAPEPDAPEPEVEIGAGRGLVLRTFTVHPEGFGADCRIADGRNVYVRTGAHRLDVGEQVAVSPGDGCWLLAGSAADA